MTFCFANRVAMLSSPPVYISAGSRADISTESSSIPKKIKRVVGPSHFSGDKGIPTSWAA